MTKEQILYLKVPDYKKITKECGCIAYDLELVPVIQYYNSDFWGDAGFSSIVEWLDKEEIDHKNDSTDTALLKQMWRAADD